MPQIDSQSLSLPTRPFLLVTVGTTKFPQLITEVSSNPDKILKAIAPFNIQTIILQVGSSIPEDLENFEKSIHAQCQDPKKPLIDVFWVDYHPNLNLYLQQAALVVSHAGAGTILERLRGISPTPNDTSPRPQFVVINDSLMDNHQQELAEAFAHDQYLYYSHCANCLDQLLVCDWTQIRPYPKPSPDLFVTAIAQVLHPECGGNNKAD